MPLNSTTTKSSLSMTKSRTQRQQEPEDPQVAIIRNDPPFPTLCEAVTDEMMKGRNPKRPILTRLVYVAEIASRDESLKALLEGINNAASKTVNANDPTSGILALEGDSSNSGGGAVNVSGICVELGSHVVCCLESEPAHIAQVMIETDRRAMALPPAPNSASAAGGRPKQRGSSIGSEAQSAAGNVSSANNASQPGNNAGPLGTAGALKNLRVLYLVDDIISRTTQHWVHVDATKAKGAQLRKDDGGGGKAAPTNASFARLDESIVKIVHNLLDMASHAQGLNKGQRETYANSGAATAHAQLLPPLSVLESCVDSGLCLTLDEYISVFTTMPVITRDFDVNHPVEPPLVYE